MLEQLVHQPEFSLGQRAENLLVEGDLAGPRLGQELAPGIGQVEPICPPVLGVGASLDPSGRADPVDEADHVPLGDQEPRGQLLLGDALAVPERRQDVELGRVGP